MSSEEATKVVRAGQAERASSRLLRLALPTAAVLGVGAAAGIAAVPAGDGTISACYAGPNGASIGGSVVAPGAVRIVDPSLGADPKGGTVASACQAGETKVSWNETGPVGPTGPVGTQGAPGAAGATGAQGPAGQAAQAESSKLVGSTAFGLSTKGGSRYIKLDGIDGESSERNHKGWIELDSMSFAAAPVTTPTGRVTFNDFTITKKIDKASPVLFKACASGKHFASVTIVAARKAGGQQQDYLKFKLTDAIISSISEGTSSDGTPLESITVRGNKLSETFLGNSPQTITITPTAG